MIKGILGTMRCSFEGRKRTFEVALGEDGKVYPISPELVDVVDYYEGYQALGMDPFDLIEGNDCLIEYLSYAGNPKKIICQRDAVPPELLAEMAEAWLGEPPFCRQDWKFSSTPNECHDLNEALFLTGPHFRTHTLYEAHLPRARKIIQRLLRKKKFVGVIGRSGKLYLKAFLQFLEVARFIQDGKHGKAGRAAFKLAELKELQAAKTPETRFLASPAFLSRGERNKQMRTALHMIERDDAWNIELEVD